MSGEDTSTKKILAIAGAFTVITGGSLWGFFSSSLEKVNQIEANTASIETNQQAISERITINTFKRYTLTSDLEDAKAKLAQFNEMENLTLNQQAEVNYLQGSITRWQTKLNELDDEQ